MATWRASRPPPPPVARRGELGIHLNQRRSSHPTRARELLFPNEPSLPPHGGNRAEQGPCLLAVVAGWACFVPSSETMDAVIWASCRGAVMTHEMRDVEDDSDIGPRVAVAGERKEGCLT